MLAACLTAAAAESSATPTAAAAESKPATQAVERQGPHIYFQEDGSRAWMPHAASLKIPQPKITAKSYFDYVDHDFYGRDVRFLSWDKRKFTDPDWIRATLKTTPEYAPMYVLPALAVWQHTKEPAYARLVVEGIRTYRDWARDAFAKGQATSPPLLHQPEYAAVAIKLLREAKALTAEDEALVRDLLTLLAENVFSWEGGGGIRYCRGTHHRAINEGIVRRIAAAWYPDHPQTPRWKQYADQQWQDWWRYGEIGINDAGYFWSSLSELVLSMHVLDQQEGFTDPRVQPMWDHIMHEVGSDGASIPYGAHGGWNSAAPARIMTLELVARYTRDGRYRWLAHRIFNYWVDTGGLEPRAYRHALVGPVGYLALASVLADDSIEPVAPEAGSRLLYRHEIVRLSDAEAKVKYPDGLDCNMDMTERVLPSKLMLRSGWEVGDLCLLVELFTRHDPLNPTSILGLVQHGSTMAMMASEKFVSRENAVRIEDLSGGATFCGAKSIVRPDGGTGQPVRVQRQLPLGYAGMEATVEPLADSPLATHAVVRVSNYMGYEVQQTREILFVKNRFALVRDTTAFGESFPCAVGPVWNTQNILPEPGPNWFNGYFHFIGLHEEPWRSPWCNRPLDLLVYHSPKPDRRLVITDRAGDPACAQVPYSTQYRWEGTPGAGDRVSFAWLAVPHPFPKDQYLFQRGGQQPYAVRKLVEGIRFVADTPELVAAKVGEEEQREEWAMLNACGAEVRLTNEGPVKELATDARCLYLDTREGQPTRVWARDATFLTASGHEVFCQTARGDVTRGEK
jgi:hypothetical protein